MDETYTNYSYDNNNQLTRVDSLFNNYTSTYTYDERGNITSKNKYSFTRDDTASDLKSSTVYEYDNEQWLDQLTAVNGTPLTYDANGNLASYGDATYTWSHGKWLSSVKDGENTYTYRYELRLGVNFLDTAISDNGTARVSYTDVSLSIEFLIALAFLLNGVPVSNTTPKPYVSTPSYGY